MGRRFLPSAERYILLLVFGFSALCAEKPNTEDMKYHAAAGRIRSQREQPRNSCTLASFCAWFFARRAKNQAQLRHVSNGLYSLAVLGVEALAGSCASDPAKASTPNCQPECPSFEPCLR